MIIVVFCRLKLGTTIAALARVVSDMLVVVSPELILAEELSVANLALEVFHTSMEQLVTDHVLFRRKVLVASLALEASAVLAVLAHVNFQTAFPAEVELADAALEGILAIVLSCPMAFQILQGLEDSAASLALIEARKTPLLSGRRGFL